MKKSEFIVLRKDEQVNDLSMNELKGGLGSNNGDKCECIDNCNYYGCGKPFYDSVLHPNCPSNRETA